MKIIPNVTNYQCDFCGKKGMYKGPMTKHEKWCPDNPNNQHACFKGCRNLIKDTEPFNGDFHGNLEYAGERTVFSCAVTGQRMYSFIAERRRLPIISEADQTRMPLECDKFQPHPEEFYGF